MTDKTLVLKHFKTVDPIIFPILQTVDWDKWLKKVPENDYFRSLCREIIGQQLASKAAEAIYGRFAKLMSDDKLLPASVLALSDQQLRDAGLSWAKVKSVMDLAHQTQTKNIHLEAMDSLSDEAVIQELIKVKGVGRWTAEMFLMFTLGREDVFSAGDLGLRKGLQKVYGEVTPKEIEAIVTAWSPYRSYGSVALWQSLENR